MKRKSSASPSWLAVVLMGGAFTTVVGVSKKYAAPDGAQSTQPVALLVAGAQAQTAEAVCVAQDTPQESLESWRQRSNAVWSVHEAAAAGDVETLQARLSEGEPANAADEMGNTPLHLAAAAGQAPAVSALLAAGADPLALNQEGLRPAELAAGAAVRAACEAGELPRRRELALFDAVRAGRVDEVSRELAAGVNPNALSADHEHSLLTTAALAGQVEVARALLAAGANPCYRERSSRYALNHAAAQGSVELITLLLAAGADPMAHTNHGAYPIHDAIWSGRTAAAVALIPCYKEIGYSPDGKGNGYPVSMAISRGNREVLQAFLRAGLDPNDPRFAGEPLLTQAAKRNDAEMLRMLLAAGADKNAADSQGKRAADYATGPAAELLR